MSKARISNQLSLKDIEIRLDKSDIAAWVWDVARKRIVWANGQAVGFWQELSVLDLIDTVFGETHPMSVQFTNAFEQVEKSLNAVDIIIDFSSIDLPSQTNCQFSKVQTPDEEGLVLIKIVAAAKKEAETTEIGAPASSENEDVIAQMLDNAPVALALFSTDGRFNYANVNCKQIFAKSLDLFVEPKHFSDWFLMDEANSNFDVALSLLDKSLKYDIANISAKLQTAFGSRVHSIIAKSVAIKPHSGAEKSDTEKYILVYLRDVADERNYEQNLIERIAKLETLNQLGSDFNFILDNEMNFVEMNGNFEQLTGYSVGQLLGENWTDIAERFEIDPDGIAFEYFAQQQSFDNLNIIWPVKDSETGLSLVWRGRSIYEEKQGEKFFAGYFVTAYENIFSLDAMDLNDDYRLNLVSNHIEVLDEDDAEDLLDSNIEVEAELKSQDNAVEQKGFDEFEPDDHEFELDDHEVEAINPEVDVDAELDDGLTSETDGFELNSTIAEDENIKNQNGSVEGKIVELAIDASETNLSDNDAVNFASLAQTLSESKDPSDSKGLSKDIGQDNIDQKLELLPNIDAVNDENDKDQAGEPVETDIVDINDNRVELAENILPAFGATPENIAKFGHQEVDIFRTILDQTPVLALVSSMPRQDGMTVLFANKQMLRELDLIQNKNQDLLLSQYCDIISVETMEHLLDFDFEQNGNITETLVNFIVDGEKRFYNAKISMIDWQNNLALQYILSPVVDLGSVSRNNDTVANIQPEKLVELVESEDNLLQFVLDGQAFIDENQYIISCNHLLNDLIGGDENQLKGKLIGDIISPEHIGVFQDYLINILMDDDRSLSLDGLELDLMDQTGEKRAVFLHIERLDKQTAEGFPSNILVNVRDISRWKNKEKTLRDAKDRAEQENVQKSGFLARISHELRTPLNAIIGFSEVMSDEKFGPLDNSRYKGYAHDINESGEHLLSLINDLLDLSKIEAGKVELNFKALDLEPLIMQAAALMQPMADKKRIIIRTSISSSLPKIVADMRSIRQIFLNLLSNSIKYSTPGSQVIMSALLDDDGEVVIRIRDTGVGMGANQLKEAMEPFKTLDMGNIVDKQGTGLGLPLTKALAEANRAEFNIESAIDAGTLVQITFPTTRVLNG